MKATVNDSCIGCGLCVGTCPAVFSTGENGMARGGEIPPEQFHDAQNARDECPTSAISIDEQ